MKQGLIGCLINQSDMMMNIILNRNTSTVGDVYISK